MTEDDFEKFFVDVIELLEKCEKLVEPMHNLCIYNKKIEDSDLLRMELFNTFFVLFNAELKKFRTHCGTFIKRDGFQETKFDEQNLMK